MKSRKNKPELTRHNSFIVSDPRYIKPKEVTNLTKYSLFTPKQLKEEYRDEQFSNAIYELEMNNKLEKKSPKQRLSLNLRSETAEIIQRAADLIGTSVELFIVDTAYNHATVLLKEHEKMLIEEELLRKFK
jgi:uncharacterized protein (DUF1778 family)